MNNNCEFKYNVGDKVVLNGSHYEKHNIEYYNQVATIRRIYKARELFEFESYEIIFNNGLSSVVFAEEINLAN